jgi:hypothetical protein
MKPLNKKAGEKILSIWWFASLALIGAAVVVVIMVYFGAFVDVRDKEAIMLQEKIMDCIVKNGYLVEEALSLSPENFLEFCNLNKNQFKEKGQFLFNITIYNSTNNVQQSITVGPMEHHQTCKALAGIPGKNLPSCIEKKHPVLFFNKETAKKESWSIYLLVASNNYGYKQPITQGGST